MIMKMKALTDREKVEGILVFDPKTQRVDADAFEYVKRKYSSAAEERLTFLAQALTAVQETRDERGLHHESFEALEHYCIPQSWIDKVLGRVV